VSRIFSHSEPGCSNHSSRQRVAREHKVTLPAGTFQMHKLLITLPLAKLNVERREILKTSEVFIYRHIHHFTWRGTWHVARVGDKTGV